ncbi:MAG: hypothetical protein IKP71_14240, partial [Candidatus Riflebacteria bacterium]|nr:hypothetical protein [Candidatus Riflebacteria bacterium]
GKIDNSSEGNLVLTTKIKGFDHYETYTKNGNIKHHYFIVLNENDFDITKLRVSFDIYDKLNKEDIINLNLKKGLFDIIYIKDIELVQKNSNTGKK